MKYPLIIWFIVDAIAGSVFAILVPSYMNITASFTDITVWAFPLGAMAGYKMIELKGTRFQAIVAGLITAVWCAVMGVTNIGIGSTFMMGSAGLSMLGGNIVSVLPFGFLLFVVNFVGAIIGTGFALTRRKA